MPMPVFLVHLLLHWHALLRLQGKESLTKHPEEQFLYHLCSRETHEHGQGVRLSK
jgi:hypothetical protein